MIKRVAAYIDSQGAFHQTREDACKAEFRRLLVDELLTGMSEHEQQWHETGIKLSVLVDRMFDIDRMIGEATKEDTRVDFAPADGSISNGT